MFAAEAKKGAGADVAEGNQPETVQMQGDNPAQPSVAGSEDEELIYYCSAVTNVSEDPKRCQMSLISYRGENDTCMLQQCRGKRVQTITMSYSEFGPDSDYPLFKQGEPIPEEKEEFSHCGKHTIFIPYNWAYDRLQRSEFDARTALETNILELTVKYNNDFQVGLSDEDRDMLRTTIIDLDTLVRDGQMMTRNTINKLMRDIEKRIGTLPASISEDLQRVLEDARRFTVRKREITGRKRARGQAMEVS